MSVSSTSPISFGTSSSASGDGSWMAQVAEALAKAMSKLQQRMMDDGKNMSSNDKNTSDNANADLQVATQEYSLIVTAISTVMKTIGEADNSLAQKQ
ncbi:MAG TPA: hypothetical protein VGV14_05615 [Rhodanobacter sp.]|nr:hypothetical protein [Rhodanobacter sp.]